MDTKTKDHNRFLAHKILSCLVNSSLVNEFDLYRDAVQKHLDLSREDMNLYNLSTIVELLTPEPTPIRFFQGVALQDYLPKYDRSFVLESYNPLSNETRDMDSTGVVNVDPDTVTMEPTVSNAETPVEEEDDAYMINMKKLLDYNNVDYTGAKFDTKTHSKAIIIKGLVDTKKLSSLGGRVNKKTGALVFSKNNIRILLKECEESNGVNKPDNPHNPDNSDSE